MVVKQNKTNAFRMNLGYMEEGKELQIIAAATHNEWSIKKHISAIDMQTG